MQQHQEPIAANKAAIDAASARFGQLDDYYIFDEVTVYFANGQAENRGVVVRVLQNKAIAGG